jgi:hypothetical protein
MSAELAIYNASVPDRMQYAQALSGSGLLPEAYRGKPANVLVALEYGAALGIPPMVSIQQVHVVQGRPVASAQLIGALVRKAGHRLRVFGDATKARCEITRADDPDFTFVAEWTIERARDAKLTGKETWRAYPANMLKARAITECARDACPEALAGVSYTAEELGDDAVVADAFPTTVEVVPQTDDGAATDSPRGNALAADGATPGDAVAAPAPSSDITDAVVIDETPDPPSWPMNDGGDRQRRNARMRALASERGMSSTDLRSFASDVVGRTLRSSTELTTDELLTVADALKVTTS